MRRKKCSIIGEKNGMGVPKKKRGSNVFLGESSYLKEEKLFSNTGGNLLVKSAVLGKRVTKNIAGLPPASISWERGCFPSIFPKRRRISRMEEGD